MLSITSAGREVILEHVATRSELAQRERVAMLAEECTEIAQLCMKILRHGIESYHPDDPERRPNRELLEREIVDFMAIRQMMLGAADIRPHGADEVGERVLSKRRWTHHQP